MSSFVFHYCQATVPVVTIRITTSLISAEQALVSMRRELPLSRGFDDVAAEAKEEWNRLLRRVDVVDPGGGRLVGWLFDYLASLIIPLLLPLPYYYVTY